MELNTSNLIFNESEAQRVDSLLTDWGLFGSRNAAQTCIKEGRVLYKKQRISKSSQLIELKATRPSDFEIISSFVDRFASRAGAKLYSALFALDISVKEKKILDLGMGRGGFADCLIQLGARNILGIDVGHSQLSSKLKRNPRVNSFEKVNARNLSEFIKQIEGNGFDVNFDLIVADLSFISMTLVTSEVAKVMKDHTEFLGLVKPQFEVKKQYLNKKGVIKSKSIYIDVEKKINIDFELKGLKIISYIESSLEGTDGNKEFFVYAKKK